MSDLIVASSQEDAAALDAFEEHYALRQGGLTMRSQAVVDGAVDTMNQARNDLVSWCDDELLPHLTAEADLFYRQAVAIPEARALVEAMLAEGRVMTGLVERARTARTPAAAVAAAYALRVMFDSHVAKTNDQLLPIVAESTQVKLAQVLKGMKELLGEDQSAQPAPAAHECNCGEHDDADYPELDARVVPHSIRHATIFGALDAVGPGGGMVLVAPHDPLPLLAQIEQREPGAFEISYLERGPEAWRLQFVRR